MDEPVVVTLCPDGRAGDRAALADVLVMAWRPGLVARCAAWFGACPGLALVVAAAGDTLIVGTRQGWLLAVRRGHRSTMRDTIADLHTWWAAGCLPRSGPAGMAVVPLGSWSAPGSCRAAPR